MDPQGVLQRFQLPHENAQIRPFGDGHINNTFLISFSKERYILQRINTGVFTKPEQVMENALLVTDFLREKYAAIGRDPARSTLRFVPTKESKFWHRDESGFWRMSRYVDNTYSL
ncbi:MAG: mucin desulfatase, partial [Clostridia bacterium]|nr:mucin desulfatase [Clostridia bacterium]